MPLEVFDLSNTAEADGALDGQMIFLSASIPDPERWLGRFDPLSITDAAVATARTLLSAGGGIVTAAHPTIAPLILYVARELSDDHALPPIVVYQSTLFTDLLPIETLDLARGGLGELVWTPASPNDRPAPGGWDASLATMREQMLSRDDLVAAIFVGGMEGIKAEFELFRRMRPSGRTYAIRAPGGAASELPTTNALTLESQLRTSRSYPALLREIVADLAS